MSTLCERPGCSEPGAVAYGMVPEDLLFWIAPLTDAPISDPNLLCRRHADAMVVPRGWTLDDRREAQPRLFKPRSPAVASPGTAPSALATATTGRRRRRTDGDGEQLQIDGTGEIERPDANGVADEDVPAPEPVAHDTTDTPWQPDFDADDDLDGLLEVSSPLLARAFRGTDRRR